MKERGELSESHLQKEEMLQKYYASQGQLVVDMFLMRAEPRFDSSAMVKTARM